MPSTELPLALLRELLQNSSLEIALKKEWGAEQKTYRQDIRTALSLSLKENFANLDERPGSLKKAISISHCPGLGGYASIAKPGCIGFDVEIEDRVQSKIAARMATPKEMTDTPSPAHLWVAKEAAYKSLGESLQPVVLSAVEISEWSQLTLHDPSTNEAQIVWKFRAFCLENSQLANGQGLVFIQKPLIFGLFASSSST